MSDFSFLLDKAGEKLRVIKYCHGCNQDAIVSVPCPNCTRQEYCSSQCMRQHKPQHELYCNLFHNASNIPGFNKYFDGSRYAKTILSAYGRHHLSNNFRGAVAFSRYPLEKYNKVVQRLTQSHRSSDAQCIQDPSGKCVIHYFILPLQALQANLAQDQDFDSRFVNLLGKIDLFEEFVPMIHMRMRFDFDHITGIEEEEVVALSYYFVHNSEV